MEYLHKGLLTGTFLYTFEAAAGVVISVSEELGYRGKSRRTKTA